MTIVSAQLKRPVVTPTFALAGTPESPSLRWFTQGLTREMVRRGHSHLGEPEPNTRFIMNVVDADRPTPFRRKAQATFVATIVEWPQQPDDILAAGYPILVRSLANLVVILVPHEHAEVHFVTPERGHYSVTANGSEESFFAEVYHRIEPLASAQLVINNIFNTDLEEELWNGDEITDQISWAGRRLAEMNLLIPAYPVSKVLSPTDLRHIRRLYGLGGLSYGNLSARKDVDRFWMSASGVDKGNLKTIGRDILMVAGFDPEKTAMVLSVPRDVEGGPRRVSVDAVEHWMIYREHPDIGAIVHVHAWMEGIRSTQINYPCGTIELAEAVAQLLRDEPDPGRAVIGLKNHGITITGPSMTEIFQRIEGRTIEPVPMP